MKVGSKHTAGEVARFLGCTIIGDAHALVSGINSLERCEAGDLILADDPKFYDKVMQSPASVILIEQEIPHPEGKTLLISANPFHDFNKLARKFAPVRLHTTMTGEDCVIADSAHLSPNCFIGNEVYIGEHVVIHPGAYIGDRTIIEEHSIIGPNTVIGHQPFSYKKTEAGLERLHALGYVHIERNVEIGALCSVNAGTTSVTRIGEGTKIDNQVHIGHDSIIGKHCLFAAKTGIAGFVTIMDHVTMWGQVGCTSGVTIGEGAVILAQSGIGKDLEGGKTYFGSPCSEVTQKFREMAALRRLPEILERI